MQLLKRIKIKPAICIVALLMSVAAIGQTVESTKVHSTKVEKQAKQLKPQETCPIMGDPIDKNLFVDYKGKRIYVCTQSCLPVLKKNPEKYIKKLEAMGQGVETIGEKPMKTSEAGYWTCPMHPQIHQAAAGRCPICGMDLVFKKTAATPQK